MEKEKREIYLLGLAGAMLLLVTACAPPARVPLPAEPVPGKAEVVAPQQVFPPQGAAQPATATEESPSVPVVTPQVVIKERYILPDKQMYAARYRQYEDLKKKYDELLFHLDWLSTEPTSPELRQCVADISSIADGYDQAIKSEASSDGEEGPTSGEKPWQVVWQDLAFIQGPCPAFYQAKVKEMAGHLKEYKGEAASRAGEQVSAYALRKEDQKAIESFKYLTENFPEWQRDPAILRQYGDVLLRQGKLKEASAIFSELLGNPASVKQAIALYRKSADLLLAVGKLNEAARQFHVLKDIEQAAAADDKITEASLDLLEGPQKREPLLSIYQNFLWQYYAYDGKNVAPKADTALSQLENFFPGNPLTQNAKLLYDQMVKAARSAVEEQLAAASRLADAQKYDQAEAVLSAIKTEGLSPDLKEKIRFTRQEITFNAQEEQKSSTWEQEQRIEQLWQQTYQYFDQHQFDKVIKAGDAFVGTKYEQQATELVAKAVDQAAIDLRKQAAALYLKARKEKNVTLRSGYLQESLALLKEIENKYPQATVMEKVKSNIAVLEKEIDSLGPMEPSSDSGYGSRKPDPGAWP